MSTSDLFACAVTVAAAMISNTLARANRRTFPRRAYDYVGGTESQHRLASNYARFGTKVLIYCHTRPPVHYTKGTIPHPLVHFMESVVPDIESAEVHYVDPAISNEQANDAWAHQENGFSNEFINRYAGQFDVVFVPDCAGPFEKDAFQPYEAFVSKLVDTIDRMCALLAPGGQMYVSKVDRSGYWRSSSNVNDDLDRLISELWARGRSVTVAHSVAWRTHCDLSTADQGLTNWILVTAN